VSPCHAWPIPAWMSRFSILCAILFVFSVVFGYNLLMRASGISVNPPVKVTWEGRIVLVSDPRLSIRHLDIPFEKRDAFYKAVHDVAPYLVTDVEAITPKRVHFGEVQQYLKALKSRWVDSKIPLADEKTAVKRAKICAECPEKVKISGCFGCSGVSKLLLHIPRDFFAHNIGCGKCSCYLNNKVWMSEEVLNVDNRDIEYPSHCWMNENL
jgi:hypothetical protein